MHYNDIPFDFDSLNIRKSVYDMQVMTLDNPYPGELPKELEKFHYYFAMDGHVSDGPSEKLPAESPRDRRPGRL